MGAFGNWRLAAAVSNAGGLGMLTAAVSRTPQRLREDILRCREATAEPFAVNLSFGSCPEIENMLETCVASKVRILQTSGYKPDSLAPRIKESGLLWLHKSTRVKDARHAEKLGADILVIMGLESTGFKNPMQLPTLTTTSYALSTLKIPFVAAGGVCDGRALAGLLTMGADAVELGTAFLATKESPLGGKAKQAIVAASLEDPRLVSRVLALPDLKSYEKAKEMRGKMELDDWLHQLEGITLKEDSWSDTLKSKSEFEAKLGNLVSLSAGMITGIVSVNELIQRLITEAELLITGRKILD